MTDRAAKYEAFLDELAPIVDGELSALERHADFLADDDEARDLRHDALAVAGEIGRAGADYVPPADLEARLLAALDAAGGGRTTSPGFAAPNEARAGEPSPAIPETSAMPITQPAGAFEASRPEASRAEGIPPPSAMPVTQPAGSFEPRGDGSDPALAATRPAGAIALPAQPAGTQRIDVRPSRKPVRGALVVVPLLGAAALAAAALLAVMLAGGDDDGDRAPEPTLATQGIDGRLESIDRAADDGQSGVTLRRAGSDTFVALASGEAIPAGAVVRTDDRTRARLTLADGSQLVLNHATELELIGDAPRSFRITRGDLVADVAHLEGAPHALFHTATGRVEVLGTKFELAATSDVTNVRVTRGVVSVASSDGASSEVRAGEEGLVRAGAAPEVAPVTDLARSMAWAELGERDARQDAGDVLPGIGSLRARRPGEQQDRERPLALAQHTVRVRIVGNVARTEIEEVFRNDGDQTLEGVYRFPLPADAQIARLALDVDGRMEEGSFVERERAAQIWRGVIRHATPVRQRQNDEEFIWVPGPWRDPAILEWQRGGQFELRIFPIPAHGERRVILGYTQTVAPEGTQRRYVYPLAHSADGSTRVGRFDVDVRVAGAEHVSASGYQVSSAAEDDATRLRFSDEGFLPKGDLVVQYELPSAQRELSFWTYRGEAASAPPDDSRERDREVQDAQRQLASDGRGYVALALRPRLPRTTARRDRDYVVVVDSSQSMVGERYERASQLAARVIGELDRRDRFAVLACDYACRAMPGGVQAPSAQSSARVAEWLASIEPAGASDLVASLREAVANVDGDRRDDRELHVVYVGDGTATVGYRRASSLADEVHRLAEAQRVVVSTVGIGSDADTLALAAIARAGGGHYVPYVPGERTAVAAMSVLETTYGVSLESPRVELPDGLSDVAPAELPTIRAGQEVIVVARMDRDRVAGDVVLRGDVAGRPFEQRYPVELVPTDAAGNRFVPRLWAAGTIQELELRGRGEDRARIIALSKGFGVMSRYTSLLVLESEAMFRAFRVDRNEQSAPSWTGEEDVVTGGSDGTMQVSAGDAADGEARLDGLGTIGAGRSAAGHLAGGGAGSGYGTAERRRSAAPMSRASAPARMPAGDMAGAAPAPMAQVAPAESSANSEWAWRDMPAPGPQLQQQQPMPMPPRQPGRWMRRVWYRAGDVAPSDGPTTAEREAARRAEQALRENEDSRDRHREAVRRLSQAGELDRALEIAEAWVARDRLDAEALTAKADILGRLGRRDDALRVLTGTVDLSPESDALQVRLARAFERAGQPERACAHRIALAEMDEADESALAAAMRCERALGRQDAAARLMAAVRDPSVRTRAEREAGEEDEEARFRGDFTVDAEWDERVDLDLTIVTPQGTRLSWMGGRTTVVGEDAVREGRERLGLRWTGAGTYLVEIDRTDPADTRVVRGELSIRVPGEQRTVPFTLRDGHATVARVRVTRESRLETVTGTVR